MSIPVQAIRLSVLAAGITSIIAFKMISSSMVEEKIDKKLESFPAGMVTYDDASVDLFGFDVHVNNVVFHAPNGKDSKIDEIVLKSFDDKHDVPNYLDLELNGMDLDVESLKYNPQTAAILDGLKYKDLKADFEVEYSFDDEKEMIDLDTLSLDIKEAGKLSLNSKIYGVKSLENIALQVMMNPASFKLSKSSIEYKNDSFFERFIAMSAKEKGISEKDFKKQYTSELSKELDKAKAKGDKYEIATLEAIEKFVDKPKSFEISIDPKEAVSLNTLNQTSDMNKLLELLDLDISAN